MAKLASATGIDPFDAFVNAWGFYCAATAIDRRPETLVLMFPKWINEALSLELFLKSLFLLRNRNPRPFRHDVCKLFDALSKADQTRIKRRLKLNLEKHPLQAKMRATRIRRDAKSILARTNGVFEKLRYWHERPSLPRDKTGRATNAGIDALAGAVLLVLLDLRPEWRNRFESLVAQGEHPCYPSTYHPLPT